MTGSNDDQQPIGERRVREFVEDIQAETPAPGGGAAASVAGALAAALLRMTSRYSLDDEDLSGDAGQLLEDVRAISGRLLELADEDRRAYEQYQAVRGSEHTEEPELMDALVRSTEVPLEMQQCCIDLLTRYRKLRDRIKTSFQADVDTAISLLEVTANTARGLANYNLQELPDGPVKQHLSETLTEQTNDFNTLQSRIEE